MHLTWGESEFGRWEQAAAEVPEALAPWIARVHGYLEETPGARRWREVPTTLVPMIISFGEPITQLDSDDGPGQVLVSFLAGMHDRPVVLEAYGRQHLVQVDLTPLGAHRLLGGMPMDEVAGRTVRLHDLFGREVAVLGERAHALSTWPQRFDLVFAVLGNRIESGPEPSAAVVGAWAALEHASGQVSVQDLADEVGWSRRHLAERFRSEVGVTPKAAGRVLRFEKACALLERAIPFVNVAAACGYADQSHFNRDFKALAGLTPTEWVARRLPVGGIAE